MPANAPYLSIVAVSRNDDHGGKLLQRMQIFIDCISEQVSRYQFPVELIIVEWNPPVDRLPLEQALSWPKPSDYLSIRIITVPPEVHKKFQHADVLPLFQMIGKNVGIRRAKGRFVLATNIDIIFSDELIRFLSQKKLEPGIFYRVDRIDVDSAIPPGAMIEEKLTYCRTHVIRINSRYYLTSMVNIRGVISDVIKNPALLRYYCRNFLYKLKTPCLHYNACGDFTLMAKEDWVALRGYPELEMYSLHIDSLFLMVAYFSGFRETALIPPLVAYHIEHSIGSGITPGAGQRALFQRLDQVHIPFLTWRECVEIALQYRDQIRKNKGKNGYNLENWGIFDQALLESKI
ncbi:hypothetical protein [Methanoregula formicica]|uniref:Glycosyltransferase n=1 Tax=Methanoregula formicica (strain DSM 22288 / NBRC 105244 / SMSP) TaxID=593750 RepID=L0HDW3_METFS|nr:hypothetical protein [Methanoregula formicica]AGB01518.1 hypothetical protein Metfor_0446 [Methanoregula formicica SMSP]